MNNLLYIYNFLSIHFYVNYIKLSTELISQDVYGSDKICY